MKNVLFIVIDGLGDRPSGSLGNMTPLESADTPNMDYLVKMSVCGMMYSLGVGVRPSSDVAHMALFGLDYNKVYTGRGPLELTGLGIDMRDGDLAWRGNFCSIDGSGNISDRRIKRHTPPRELLDKLKSIVIDEVTFELYSVAEHRFALRARGKNLSADITDSDPHIEGVPPMKVCAKSNDKAALNTANIVAKYLCKVRDICCNDKTATEMNINGILLRGVGVKPHWDSLSKRYGFARACAVANNSLYNGVARNMGMKVKVEKHFKNYLDYYAVSSKIVQTELNQNDLVFWHLQEGDLFGEDGDFLGKKHVIEQMDKAIAIVKELNLAETLVVLTADHSTPCALKAHSGDAVPVVFAGECVRVDDIDRIGERSCAKGSLGTIFGRDLMPLILNYLGKAPLIGG